ncbi:MAG: NAD(P)/FAD-dependent oxidoreductase [Parvibaculaceae bacterium]
MTGAESLLAEDFCDKPLWWRDAGGTAANESAVPRSVDVVIVGSGITGLSAAIALARHGAGAVICDAAELGFGGSTRSAGVIGRSLKKGFSRIVAEDGLQQACAFYGEARTAFDFILHFIEVNGIDCGLRSSGRFIAANTPEHYEAIARDLEEKKRHLGDDFEMIPQARQREEIGTDVYCGGAVVPDHKTLDPYRLHRGLLALAERAGVVILPHTRVTRIDRRSDRFGVVTNRGECTARHVIVATNGYTGPELLWFRRRLIPLNAYMIATQELAMTAMRDVLPTLRTFNDYRIDTEYARPCPEGKRIIFGGLTGRNYADGQDIARRLRQKMIRLFPQLAETRISRAWSGRCAATFDLYPHIGQHEGLHYAMGYCFGSGLPLGLLFGHKTALRILGIKGGETAFDDEAFTTRAFYRGNAWFMPLLMEYYRWRERSGF